MNDFYKILGVDRDAPKSVIIAVFRALSKHHQGSNPLFPMEKSKELIQLEQAYAVLSDPQKRKKYDALLKQKEQMTSQKHVDAPVAATPIPKENTQPVPAPLPQQVAQQEKPDAPENTSNTPDTINPTVEAEEQEDELQQAYTALIGDKSTEYYLDEFERFDQQQKRGGTSWFGSMNWFSGLFTVPWMFYRKMYVWGVVFTIVTLIITTAAKIVNDVANHLSPESIVLNGQITRAIYAIVIIGFFGKIGNRLYYNRCQRFIKKSYNMPAIKRNNYLQNKGGVTYIPIYIFSALFLIGFLAATVLPISASGNKPKPAVVQPTNQQESTWDDYVAEYEVEQQQIYENLVQAANEKNKKLPERLSNELTFYKVIVGKDLSVNEFYAVHNVSYSNAKQNLIKWEPELRLDVCADVSMTRNMEYGFTYKYIYSMPSGEEIHRTQINKYSCR